MPGNAPRQMQPPPTQHGMQNLPNNQLMAAQFHAMHTMQALAQERNIDFSVHANANLMAQLLPLMQSRMAAQQKASESNVAVLPLIQSPPLPPPRQPQQQIAPQGVCNQEGPGQKPSDKQVRHVDSSEKETRSMPLANGLITPKEENLVREEKSTMLVSRVQVSGGAMQETTPAGASTKEDQQSPIFSPKLDQDAEHGPQNIPVGNDLPADRGKIVATQLPVSDATQVRKPTQANTASVPKDSNYARKYHGPLSEFPFFTRKHDSMSSSGMINTNNNLTLAYDVKDLLFEEGTEVLSIKRCENLRKICGLLAVNLKRKRIRPDLVLRLLIEEKKLKLLDLQARIRDAVYPQQQEIMAMPDRPYRKFIRLCERQRMELARQTEEYLNKLGSKITAAKSQQEVEEAANAAAAAARLQGLSEEEVRAATTCAGEEVMNDKKPIYRNECP
ncbi:unnamed protein product [Linum tenue]|uniref:GLTSCR protein conserved domain-containing protein n=1 Tax=Linum tenue TaxID=586396 RepID=A0AAV0KV51_9ROSI|nr:unnamed protein product [Linum tenue]